ncbi:DUF2917 domain-containing protein [Paracidovorax wautersii]|uniref:DUF2917 domain-containing protein n=1 Tax=Paracidovorax wautersii TaxID=1177982 RepID=A0A1I2C1V4_9BURK|nr:DUF2917 domain-containing protein [Paracidovorax wautersii]SFE62108.1 Protein of unknown function [Paracidovorax wautersii]
MNPIHVLTQKTSSLSGDVAVQDADIHTLPMGQAKSLLSPTAMSLRVMRGHAWVTLDDGPNGACDQAAGDIFLHAGQILWVVAGQRVVLEPLGREALQFCWRVAGAASVANVACDAPARGAAAHPAAQGA